MKDTQKEFKPSSWSIDNKTAIYVITAIITLAGIFSYIKLPKEKFPDVVIPTIYVTTIYPGAAPSDIENLVSKPLEKQIKSISGVKKLTSNSVQDFSMVMVEFNTDVDVAEAKRKVKDAVDKARSELPSDLPKEPSVMEVDFSEMPILYVNISGDFDLNKLKKYADVAKDKIEGLKEITRVDVVGALDREIQINVDMYKMEAANLTMRDVEMAVAYENMRISGGNLDMDGMKRSVSISGEFTSVDQIKNLALRSMSGATVYLKDVADVKDSFKEQESYARLNGKNVITLNIIKRSGENLIDASDKVRGIMDELKVSTYPRELEVVLTGDQSTETRVTLKDLINTIVIGFILVTIILMFFMGATNAIFVGLSVPLSCFLAFMFFPSMGFSLNMIVLFSFLLALGIVVDDAIVVVENTHRIFDNGKMPIVKAAKLAAGEVFVPVLAGTLTTIAPFVPLAFWGGIIGKFMFFLPVTLIVTLFASLVVAYIINPVFAVDFMKPHEDESTEEFKKKSRKSSRKTAIILGAIALLGYISGSLAFGNLMLVFMGLYFLHKYALKHTIEKFQNKAWPKVQEKYKQLITWALIGKRPLGLLGATMGLLVFSFILVGIVKPKVDFFPNAEPNFTYVYIKLPVGTDQRYTDSVTKILEGKVYKVLGMENGKENPLVESVISNVAVGATDPQEGDRSTASNKSKISIAFVEFAHRDGKSTQEVLDKVRESMKGVVPGAEITVSKESNGPPTGKPVSIEIMGDDFNELIATSKGLKRYLDSIGIKGVEELKSDLQDKKPEIDIAINRERANREGISTAQIGMELRNAIFGKEVSKFKDNNDEYPINLRYNKAQRENINQLVNLKISYRDMNMGGMIRQVPLSALADVQYANAFGGIKRKAQKRIVTLSSNVLSEYNPNEVVAQVQAAVENFKKPESVSITMGGEQEQQAETAGFLGNAMLISLGLILLILVTQFNSISKPILILSEILFSLIGVLLGFSIFGMNISIVMTGIGIVALAGIVVRNGILLVEFTDLLMEQGMPLKEAIIEAGKTRMTPVLLTATATMLGLVPLAVGFNIDFLSLLETGNPHIFFGGDSVAFWGPLSWTMIFGLSFATFLTLILVPCMYYLNETGKARLYGWFGKKYVSKPEKKYLESLEMTHN